MEKDQPGSSQNHHVLPRTMYKITEQLDEEEAEEEGQLIVVDELFEDEEEEVDENADVPKAFNAFDGNSHESSRKNGEICSSPMSNGITTQRPLSPVIKQENGEICSSPMSNGISTQRPLSPVIKQEVVDSRPSVELGEANGTVDVNEQDSREIKPIAATDRPRAVQPEKRHFCEVCNKGFPYLSILESHRRCHTGEKPFECRFCSKHFAQKATLQVHERTHTGDKPYKCAYCEKCFAQYGTKTVHERSSHLRIRNYKCPMCNKSLSSPSALYTHKKTHGDKAFQCEFCPKTFTLKNYLKLHVKQVHLQTERKYSCPHCGKRFGYTGSLQVHVRQHTGEKPYQCKYCEKSFSSQGNLQSHERTHTGVRPYACKHCLRSFIQKSQLTAHLATHIDTDTDGSAATPPDASVAVPLNPVASAAEESAPSSKSSDFACNICGKRYAHACSLTTHMRTHSGEKPFKCTYCDKTFTNQGNMQVHMRVHTGEKPFKCSACNKCYAQKVGLKIHLEQCPLATRNTSRDSGIRLSASSSSNASSANLRSSSSPGNIDSPPGDDLAARLAAACHPAPMYGLQLRGGAENYMIVGGQTRPIDVDATLQQRQQLPSGLTASTVQLQNLYDDYTTPMAQPQPTRVSSLSFPTTILWSPQATTSSGLSPLQGSNVPQQSDNCTALASEQLLSAFHPPKPTVQEAANNNNDLLKALQEISHQILLQQLQLGTLPSGNSASLDTLSLLQLLQPPNSPSHSSLSSLLPSHFSPSSIAPPSALSAQLITGPSPTGTSFLAPLGS